MILAALVTLVANLRCARVSRAALRRRQNNKNTQPARQQKFAFCRRDAARGSRGACRASSSAHLLDRLRDGHRGGEAQRLHLIDLFDANFQDERHVLRVVKKKNNGNKRKPNDTRNNQIDTKKIVERCTNNNKNNNKQVCPQQRNNSVTTFFLLCVVVVVVVVAQLDVVVGQSMRLDEFMQTKVIAQQRPHVSGDGDALEQRQQLQKRVVGPIVVPTLNRNAVSELSRTHAHTTQSTTKRTKVHRK